MARRYEGSKKDLAEDKRGAKRRGMSMKDYENTAEDRAEDAAGERRIKVKGHMRSPRRPPPAPPMPGPHEFSPDQEKAMRGGGGPPQDADLVPNEDI